MGQKKSSSVEKLSEKLDSAVETLETLEGFVNNNPEYSELAPYLRIAMASLRTAMGLYDGPLKLSTNAKKLAFELKDEQKHSGVES